MAIPINPVLPVLAAQQVGGVVLDAVLLQPGTVITAQVQQILSADLVRIAIASLSIDVASEVPLQPGQTLQLAVSQNTDGIRLAVVGQGSDTAPQSGGATTTSGDAVTLSPSAQADVTASRPIIVAPKNDLTPVERAVVSAASQTAATEQGSLAPLFANLGAAATSGNLPPKLQQAVAQVLALQTSLDPTLAGGDIKTAFQKSGIFLEASLAAGSIPSGGVPDLKAALIVLRQALQSTLGDNPSPVPPLATQPATVATLVPATAPGAAVATPANTVTPTAIVTGDAITPNAPSPTDATTPLDAAVLPNAEVPPNAAQPPNPAPPPNSATPATSAPIPNPSATPGVTPPPAAVDVAEIVFPQPRLPVAADVAQATSATVPRSALAAALDNGPTAGATLNLLQETLQELGNPARAASSPIPSEGTLRPNAPPPPFRGALPAAQPIASPSIVPQAPLAATAHHLLEETDAALARQTLLQVASLPDHVDTQGQRIDIGAPRWNFEIPFATPQGTAMAQFEISGDGGGREVEATKRVWRARFSLDVEPSGPVHAEIALTGDKTSVRMWAERPATVAQLRAGVSQLSQALSRAELQPGDIVIRDGAPPQATPARAGHFLDRAL